jgi:hypothetical protein
MRTLAVCCVIAFLLLPSVSSAQRDPKQTNVIQATFYSGPTSYEPKPEHPMWKKAGSVTFQHDAIGDPLVDHRTTVRALWTSDTLWLLFACGYDDKLTIGPDAQSAKETNKLWEVSDVAEAFIAPNLDDITRYKEFQVSPGSQWVDLDINRTAKNHDASWNSGFRSAARIDQEKHIWYALMAIPLKAFGVPTPTPGARWRLNFFRSEFGPPRRSVVWQPTHERNFHVPDRFGWMEFRK